MRKKLKRFYIMKTYLYSVSSCLQFRFMYQLPLFSYSLTFEADDAYVNGGRLREDLREDLI